MPVTQWAPPFVVDPDVARTLSHRGTAAGADGRSAVLYIDQEGRDERLFLALFNGNGTRATGHAGDIAVATLTGLVDSPAQVIALDGGGYAVAYERTSARIGSGIDVVIQVFSADGAVLRTATVANQSLAGDQSVTAATALEDGGFVVFWQYADDFNRQIVARIFEADGTPRTGDFVVASRSGSPTIPYRFVSAEPTPDGGFVVHDDFAGGTIRVYDSGGAKVAAKVLVDAANAIPVPLDDGTFFTISDRVLRHLDGNAEQIGGDIILDADHGGWVGSKAAAEIMPDGRIALVAGYQDGMYSAAYDLFLINQDGSFERVAQDILDAVLPSGDARGPVVSALPDGRLFVSMQRTVGTVTVTDEDVVAQIFDPRPGAVTLNGTFHDDQYVGTSQGDTLSGFFGDDILWGGRGDDLLKGEAGDDTLRGQRGNDILTGGAGDDVLDGNRNDDRLSGGSGGDLLNAGAGNDFLVGGGGADFLDGGAGDDILTAGGGGDALKGGRGADILTGGKGADSFTFYRGDGSDRITDFKRGADTLFLDDDIWGGGLTAQQVIDTYAAAQGGDLVFDFGAGDVLRLQGLGAGAGLADDIAFV